MRCGGRGGGHLECDEDVRKTSAIKLWCDAATFWPTVITTSST